MKQKQDLSPKLAVVGVGGAGSNAVNNMIRSGLQGVEFVVCNTDAQALKESLADTKIQLGPEVTKGLGAGSKPDVGKAAAEESIETIMNALRGINMIFVTAGMGGGTGTGAAPVIARAAKEAGILTVGVVTRPFHFEGAHRTQASEQGIVAMNSAVDTLLVIPNQNLFRLATEQTTFSDAFAMADDVLYSGVRTFTDLMVKHGLINLDFADICAVMKEMTGKAMMGTGQASGERRAIDAAEQAISCPLLDNDVSMRGAKSVLINVSGGHDMKLFEVDEAANRVREEVDPEANIIFGATFDDSLKGELRVAVVATGIYGPQEELSPDQNVLDSASAEEEDSPYENQGYFSAHKSNTDTNLGASALDDHALLGSTHSAEELMNKKAEDDDFRLTGSFFNRRGSNAASDSFSDSEALHKTTADNGSSKNQITPPPKKRRTFSLLERLGMRRSFAEKTSEETNEMPAAEQSDGSDAGAIASIAAEESSEENLSAKKASVMPLSAGDKKKKAATPETSSGMRKKDDGFSEDDDDSDLPAFMRMRQ